MTLGADVTPGAVWCANKLPVQNGFNLRLGFSGVASESTQSESCKSFPIATHARVVFQTGSWWNLDPLLSSHIRVACTEEENTSKKDIMKKHVRSIVEEDVPPSPESIPHTVPTPTTLPHGLAEDDVLSFLSFTGKIANAIAFLEEAGLLDQRANYKGPLLCILREPEKESIRSSENQAKAVATRATTKPPSSDEMDSATMAAIHAISDWTYCMHNVKCTRGCKCSTCDTARPRRAQTPTNAT